MEGLDTCKFKGGGEGEAGVWQKRRGGVFEEGGRYTNAHHDDKKFLSIFPKMSSEIFCSKIC